MAGELRRGSALLTKDGVVIHVDTIEKREGKFKVYNFEVEHTHTYYVSSLGVLVHNQCKPPAPFWDKFRKPYPTKPNRAGKPQPYNPKTGEYLPYSANSPGMGQGPSTATSVAAGIAQGIAAGATPGAEPPPPVNGPQQIGQAIGQILGAILGRLGWF